MLKTFLQHIAVFLSNKRLEKAANIRKMRIFCEFPKMALKQRLKPLVAIFLQLSNWSHLPNISCLLKSFFIEQLQCVVETFLACFFCIFNFLAKVTILQRL